MTRSNTVFILAAFWLSGGILLGAPIPKEAQAHLKAGIEMIKQAKSVEDYDNAVREFEQVVVLAPGYADGYYYLGETLAASRGKVSRAIRNLNRYLELAPADAPDRAEISAELTRLKGMREKARRTELNGLELVYLADGIYVRSVVEGSSFLGGRLQKGDKIVAVAGKSVEGMDMDRFYDLVHAVKEEVKANRRLREGPAFVVTVVRTSFGDKPTAPMDIYLNKEAFFSELYDVDDEDFDGVASGSGVSVFIFWKPQCAECVKSVPVAEKIAVVRKSQLKAYSMNTAENPETVQKLQIEAVPVILVYSEGKMVARLDGVQTEQSLEKVLVPLLGLPYAAPRGGGR